MACQAMRRIVVLSITIILTGVFLPAGNQVQAAANGIREKRVEAPQQALERLRRAVGYMKINKNPTLIDNQKLIDAQKELLKLESKLGIAKKATNKFPNIFRNFNIKRRITTAAGAGWAYFRNQDPPLIIVELVVLCGAVHIMTQVDWKWPVDKIRDGLSQINQTKLEWQKASQRANTKTDVLDHYAALMDDQKYDMAEMLLDAMPEKDVFIITPGFIIQNIDHKFALACASAGMNPETGDCRLEDLPPEFLSHILPYRSGAESEQEMQLEVDTRLGTTDTAETTEVTHKEEQYCNNQRWQGVACAVLWDPISELSLANSQDIYSDLPGLRGSGSKFRFQKLVGLASTSMARWEITDLTHYQLPFRYDYFHKPRQNEAVPFNEDQQMEERSVFIFDKGNLKTIDLRDYGQSGGLICYSRNKGVYSYLRVPPGTRYVQLEDLKGNYFFTPSINGLEARCREHGIGYKIDISDLPPPPPPSASVRD